MCSIFVLWNYGWKTVRLAQLTTLCSWSLKPSLPDSCAMHDVETHQWWLCQHHEVMLSVLLVLWGLVHSSFLPSLMVDQARTRLVIIFYKCMKNKTGPYRTSPLQFQMVTEPVVAGPEPTLVLTSPLTGQDQLPTYYLQSIIIYLLLIINVWSLLMA